MIMPETGPIPKVTGKRREMVPAGPIPGRTPIRVPMKTPTKQYNKLAAVKATWIPKEKFSKKPVIERSFQNQNPKIPPGN
jgi:hypothetical protein